ncbi:MAG TPA: site-specific integrase, partial [Pirellulaceae bacterium]|nr:site-specific integrase [Pirellulaceae bacterium]
DFQRLPIDEHFAAYRDHKTAKGLNAVRLRNTQSRLERIARECGFGRLSDLDSNGFERWLALRTAEGMSPGNRNEYRQELVGFGNWCVKSRRLLVNPFADVPRADAKSNPSRKRRSMTEDELRRLLVVARWRPLAEYGRQSVRVEPQKAAAGRKRSNWTYLELTFDELEAAIVRARQRLAAKPAFVADLERRGRERALVYKTLVLTGLRKGELAALTVGQLELDAEPPFVVLNAADEKNRQGSTLPLRSDLAADLRQWLADKAATRQEAARNAPTVRIDSEAVEPRKRVTVRMRRREGQTCQGATALPSNERLFVVPAGLVRILDRDLQAAGIPKRDDRGRTLDVHALRHSFGTLLSKGGVTPRTAQAVMRHSSVELTMNVYTDPRLLDLHAAVDLLPELPLEGFDRLRQVATGTAGETTCERSSLAPTLAPTRFNRGQNLSLAGNPAADGSTGLDRDRLAVSASPVKRNNPLSLA